MNITVTPLDKDDREQWQQLYYKYADFYQMPMDEDILDNIWSWIFDDHEDFYALMAKDEDGKALGLMHYRAMPSPLRGKKTGFLDDLYVTPEARGTGVVERLFEKLEADGKAKEWPSIRWITAENNYRGRAVYDRLAEKTIWQTYQLTL